MNIESGGMSILKPGMAAFSDEIRKHSGENLNRCLHCRTCAGGCPFSADMDYAPHGVFRLAQFNMRRTALECGTIWICVGCHTCAVQCPAAIDIAAIMDTLRQFALAENVKIAEPGILGFHREVLNSVKQYGRTHKLEIMLRHKARTGTWFTDMDIGLKMLAKRKLDILPSKVKAVGEVRRMFESGGK